MNNVNLVVAENLKSIRVAKGWSQRFVANQLGIAQRTISRAECGCGVSTHTLKRLCGLYQISASTLYKKKEILDKKTIKVNPIPNDVVARIVLQSDLVNEIQREVILQFNDIIQREAIMYREEVEVLLSEFISKKEHYSLQDIIYCCMMMNQQTIKNIRLLSVS